MSRILFCALMLFSSVAFASGDVYIMPTQSLDRGETYGSFGLDINQPVYKKLAYKSWSALGDDVVYSPNNRLNWFETRQGVAYPISSVWNVEGGYDAHIIWGVPGLAAHDNGVYVKLDYKLW